VKALLCRTRNVGDADVKQHTTCVGGCTPTKNHLRDLLFDVELNTDPNLLRFSLPGMWYSLPAANQRLEDSCIVDEGDVVLCVGGDNDLMWYYETAADGGLEDGVTVGMQVERAWERSRA